MIQIVEGLFLGDREAACNRARLERAGITHIVNCADELPCYHEEAFTYLALRLHDPDPYLHRRLAEACAFIDAGRRQGKVLVHCFAAVSRSPAVVLAYLCHQGEPLPQAARRLAALILTNPDPIFLRQLAEHFGADGAEEELERLEMILLGRE
jgi:predicted protein tyrosine phosphatase